jgi:hypothetical protein
VTESQESDLVVDIQPAFVDHSTFLGLMISNNFAVTVWTIVNPPILASWSQHRRVRAELLQPNNGDVLIRRYVHSVHFHRFRARRYTRK